MRDLTKSAARLSWALFVYGAQEMASQVRREPDDGSETEKHLREEAEQLTEDAEGRLDSEFHSLYELGEKAGERMIDLGFELMDPRRAVDRAVGVMKWFSDLSHRDSEGSKKDDAEPEQPS
jgi:hypothetical protein